MPPFNPTDRLALDAFLNSALREGALTEARATSDGLCFRLADGACVTVAATACSTLRSRFGDAVLHDGDAAGPIAPEALLSRLAAPLGETFVRRVQDSLRATRLAPPPVGDAETWTFMQAEQALRAGHPLHPCPRSREGMSPADALLYAPEHGARFPLSWIAAPRASLLMSRSAERAFGALAEADGAPAPPAGQALLCLHPWQARRPEVAAALAAEGASVLGPGRGLWGATASMRTLHCWRAPFMVKTSLSLRLTNSIRTLRPAEALRGVQISQLLDSALGASIAAATPTLHILREPHFAALAAAPALTLAALRDNPFRDPAAPGPAMLASLCETPPEGPSPLGAMILRRARGRAGGGGVAEAACAWFDRFLAVAILPLLELRARWGLLFGAHQQNLTLSLRDGLPVAAFIRDCQGTGHLSAFHDRLALHAPQIGEGAGNRVDAALGDALLTYYVVVNATMNTVATLALDGLAPEAALLARWRVALEGARAATPGERTLYDKLLDGPALPCKGNFDTTRRGVNEADGDASGQRATFIDLPNPLAALVAPGA